ncbi:MAG: DUF5693 family protein [Clostridia bacterium]
MTKKRVYNIVKAAIALLMVLIILPSVVQRVSNESQNKNVVVSLLYNDIKMKLSKEDLDRELDEYKKLGVNTITVQEEDLNSLISSGTITCIKYNVLLHKYDDESEDMIKQIKNLSHITNDSYILVTKRDDSKAFLKKWIPLKYSDEEYAYFKTAYGADMYVLYDGTPLTYQISVGYMESDLKYLHDKGFDIAFDARIKNYKVQGYLDEYDRLIKEYGVKYFNIRDNYRHPKKEKEAAANYKGISNLIKNNDLVLVVTENPDQLSNEKPIGYATIFNDNSDKVIRSYETYIVQNSDPTEYMFRYYQYLNSTIDRNIRFINVTQVTNATGTHLEQNELTKKAVKTYIDKINSIGYNTDGFTLNYDYQDVNRRLTAAAALVLMGIMLLTLIEWLMGRSYVQLTALAAICCVLGAAATFKLPVSLVQLYPSVFAVLAPCFCLTSVFVFAENMKDKLDRWKYISSMLLLALVSLCLCGLVQGGLLSGIDYYINFTIFRGIKLSLYAPMVFSMLAYYMVFIKKRNVNILWDAKNLLTARVQVYWLILIAIFAGVGMVYIVRSGNVNEISSLEEAMRTFITEYFPARPRTKEFIAWPCLMLFAYYTKVRRIPLASFVFGVGSSILFASVINSFCHVFTSLVTIYTRVFVGVFISIFICIFVYIINKYFLKLVDLIVRTEKELYEEEK